MKKVLIISCLLLLLIIPVYKITKKEKTLTVFNETKENIINPKEERLYNIKFKDFGINDLKTIKNKFDIREIVPRNPDEKKYSYKCKTNVEIIEDFMKDYSLYLKNHNQEEFSTYVLVKNFKIKSIKVLDSKENIDKYLKPYKYEVDYE